MSKVQVENEIPAHKRKKGKKVFRIESRLTVEGYNREVQEYADRLKGDLEWSSGYSKYEKLKDVEAAFKDSIKKRSSGTGYSYYHYKNREFRIMDGDDNELERG